MSQRVEEHLIHLIKLVEKIDPSKSKPTISLEDLAKISPVEDDQYQ